MKPFHCFTSTEQNRVSHTEHAEPFVVQEEVFDRSPDELTHRFAENSVCSPAGQPWQELTTHPVSQQSVENIHYIAFGVNLLKPSAHKCTRSSDHALSSWEIFSLSPVLVPMHTPRLCTSGGQDFLSFSLLWGIGPRYLVQQKWVSGLALRGGIRLQSLIGVFYHHWTALP